MGRKTNEQARLEGSGPFREKQSRDIDVAAAERARIVAKMRTDYPHNRHAQEWADWIEREST
jgi:hypothetical protein